MNRGIRLTLRHRTVLEIMTHDDLVWDAGAGVYRDASNQKNGYEAQLFSDLLAVGLATDHWLPTAIGLTALAEKWPEWLPLKSGE